MSVDYNYRNAFDLHSLTQSFEPQLDSNKIYKKTCPKISELPCKFPLPACCGAPNQSICPLYFCDAVYFLYGQFDFLYGKLFYFLYGQLDISYDQADFSYGQLFTYYIGQCKTQTTEFRLQTADRG